MRKVEFYLRNVSHRVEFAFLLEAEYADDVLEYFDQPHPPMQLKYLDKQGRRQTPLHTADYFVLSYHSAGWQECKPVQELTRLAEKQPNRYVLDSQGQWHCPPGEAYAARLGLTYQVRASDQINWRAQENWLVLEDYYHDLERLTVPEDVLLTLRQMVDETPGMTLAEVHRVTPSLPTDWINIAVAKRQLYVDLLTHRLTDRERTPVYPDEPTARALTYRTPHPAQSDSSAHPVLMEQGQQVTWDGQPWTIGNIGETEVTLISKVGVPFALAQTAFEVLVRESKIVGKTTSMPSNFTEEGRTRLAQASEQDLATAVFRHRVIHPEVYDDEEQHRLTPHIAAVPQRTKYHWQRLDREGDVRYGSGFIGLLPRYQQCGGTRKLDPAVIALVEKVLRSHYDTVTRKLKRGAYGEYLLQSKEQGLRSVSQSTFYAQAKQHLSTYDQILVREGKRAAYRHKDIYRTGIPTTSRHGIYAWSMAHIDHTELDLELFDSATDQPLGKCWLTLMILSHPRRIVALSLSFDPPSYRSCLSVLRQCVKRFGQLPTAITVDGGPEFRSTYFEQLLALYRVRKHQRPSSEPRYGAPQERLFGTMNTQASKQPRQLSHTTNPRKLGVWTLPKLAERVVRWAFEEYDLQPHTALSMTPRAAYEQSLEQDGARIHRMIPYDDTFTIATFPTTSKGKALIQPGRGVRINHLDYWCEAMRDPTVERTSVAVRYDPFDVSVGYVYLKGCWRTCIIAYDELAGCSERELQIIAEEVRKRKRLVQGRTQVEVTQEQLAQFRRDNAATEVVLRQQRKDRETLAAVRALDGQSSPTGSPPLASPPVSPRVDGTSSTKTERPGEDKLLIFRRIR